MSKKYRIQLTAAERQELETLVSARKTAVTRRQRAQILLASDEAHSGGALPDAAIARAIGVNVTTVERTRRNLWEHGMEVAVQGWPVHRKVTAAKMDGWTEAHLVAAACGPPPEGRARWTLELLGAHLVALKLVESISPATEGRALKKRAQTLAGRVLVPAAGRECRLRLRDGGCARRV